MIPALALVTSALSALAPSGAAAASGVASAVAGASGDFGQVLAKVSNDAVQKLKTAEGAALSGIEGKASTQEVVETVMSAQESLQTALAIRDKAVAAFQEISRMAI